MTTSCELAIELNFTKKYIKVEREMQFIVIRQEVLIDVASRLLAVCLDLDKRSNN